MKITIRLLNLLSAAMVREDKRREGMWSIEKTHRQ